MVRRTRPSRPPSRVLPMVLAAAVALAGFSVLMVRLEITREGYRLSELRAEIARLEVANRGLRLKAAELSSYRRLKRLARRYGLEPADRDHVVTLK